MANKNLANAKKAKNDEFYTRFEDINKEVQAYLEYDPDVFRGKIVLCPCDDPYESNFFKFFALMFNKLGLKKLIATCFAGSPIANTQLSLFDDEQVENKTTRVPHKIEITEVEEPPESGLQGLENIEWLLANRKNVLTRLEGDGDFRSDEITKLRDEADIIVTNPPFSQFRDFVAWIFEVQKQFLIIGNMNAITYKEIFPLIKENKMWLGVTEFNKGMYFYVPDGFVYSPTYKFEREIDGQKVNRVAGCCWFTNIDHGRRHKPLELMTMEKNLKRSRELKGKDSYDKYDNYDAIEVPSFITIPDDYDGAMGVPITFLDKYCPEQFEILGATESEGKGFSKGLWDETSKVSQALVNGQKVYKRIFIKKVEHKNEKQTKSAKADGVSNCPLCAIGNDANKSKIWLIKEMDADHVTAWSKGGVTDVSNCQMLCKVHNRAKGNK
ncbi:MAG: HNH endonuclease [Oscillospiraceae bacterium]|nr:HNH endonuclease [Oscillospiraceae bacterium]